MKIACVCNINHSQYILARYLRDMGHEVTLFLMEEYPHFYPEFDSYGPVEGIRVVELPWKHKMLYKVSKKEILSYLGGFDFYCGSEFAPAFLFKAGIRMDIYIPIGTDLIDYPFQKPRGWIPETWAIDEYQFNLFQRGGIKRAGAVFMNEGGDAHLEAALKKSGFRGRRYPVSLPYLYLPEYQSEKAVSRYEKEIAELRGKYGLLLISHGRNEFLNPESIHYKGTDIMLRGLAEYIRSGHRDVCLVMTEYGNDWKAARDLAEELGISEHIYWLPQSGRKDIFPVLKYFDAAFGVLSYPHWSYNVAMEALAAGVPLIRRKGTTESRNMYPFMGIVNQGDVIQTLQNLERNEVKDLNGQEWFINRNQGVLKDLSEALSAAASGNRPLNSLSMECAEWIYLNQVVRRISKLSWKLNSGFRRAGA